MSLLCLDRCVERWPGTAYTSELYGIISKACLQSYDARGVDKQQSGFSFASPSSVPEPQSSPDSYAQSQSARSQHPTPFPNAPQFGFVFDSPPETMGAYTFDPNFPPQPTFRSNSIFCNPGSDSNGRRFSYFPPDFMQSGDAALEDLAASTVSPDHTLTSPSDHNSTQLPTPPESVPAGPTVRSPPGLVHQASNMSDASADPGALSVQTNMSPPQKFVPAQIQTAQVIPNFTTSRPQPANPQQRPLPVGTSPADWFSPPAPFFSPYNFGMSGGFLNDAMPNTFAESPGAALGLQSIGTGIETMGSYSYVPPGRQGSLTHSQQMELMNVLETEGVGDIDAFLNAGNNMADTRWY